MTGENTHYEQVNPQDTAPVAPPPPAASAPVYPAAPGARRPNLPYKSPVLATVLSLMPGLGQIYTGYYQHGFIFVLIPAAIIALLSSGAAHGLEPLLGMFLAFFWIFNMVDANRRAAHYNRALEGLGAAEIPEDFQMPGAKGSVPAGLILIVLGGLILMDLNTNWSMEWVENWWPIILVIFGGWLVFKARDRSE